MSERDEHEAPSARLYRVVGHLPDGRRATMFIEAASAEAARDAALAGTPPCEPMARVLFAFEIETVHGQRIGPIVSFDGVERED